ncbi:hypothetical protein OPQ81_011631 [Rhizoctonia solani]|nr:hypothetical protein OPQ81_011631 [Rhizoctonia solani]
MDYSVPISPITPRRPVPEAIGTEPGDRYTQLLHRTRSRSDSRSRHASVAQQGLGNRRDTMFINSLKETTPTIAESSRLPEGRDERNVPFVFHTPNPTGQPIHVSVLPFGPSRKHSSLAAASTNIHTPPPLYTGYGPLRAPATEPIVQHAQFDHTLRTQGPEWEQSQNPYGTPNSGLRHSNAYSAYYASPIPPPQPVIATGLSPGFFELYGYPPGRTNMIQPHVQPEDWDDEEEKHRLANYHAHIDWDPDDECDDPEPSVAARRPYNEATLPGYRPPAGVDYPQSLKTDWDTRSRTTITVGGETGRRQLITENICRG